MSGRGFQANFGIEPQVGRIMTGRERAIRMTDEAGGSIAGEELRSAFAISDAYVLTAWHCVSDNTDEVNWFRLRYLSIDGPRSVYIPMRVADHSSGLDVAVLAVDTSSLEQVGLSWSTASGILRAASFQLSTRVQVADPVRVMGFQIGRAHV